MTHVSLYRRYRSQTFEEIVGQEHITTTLANAVAEGKLHHAYLFTGPRGTGKTSTARILAKAVNCVEGPTPTPCNACEHCTAITTGSSVDTIEIDAASHGGVDDVRDLRDRVAFAPASARMKVYIVDECHMLSTAGWNAFLKTVEEPPGHVLFVFATTEPHKVLPTILSRTQRFDFRRIPAAKLAAHCERVAAAEGISLEPGALELIVRAGDGSARDTLSVLDQVVAFTGQAVHIRGVVEVLGSISDEHLHDLADLLAAGDVPGLVRLIGRLADAGQDLRQLARDTVEHLRKLFLLQTAPDAGLVDGTPEQLARLAEQAGRLGRTELLRAMELVAEAQAQMRRGHVRLPLELALCKAALPEAAGDPAALAARMDRLERRTGVVGTAARASDPQPVPDPQPLPDPEPQPVPDPEPQPPPVPDPEPRPVPDPEPQPPPVPDPEPRPVPDPEPQPPPVPDPERPPAPDPRPQPVPEPEPTPDPTAAGQAQPVVAPVDLDLVRDSWPAVLEQAKQASRRFHAFLTPGQPVAVRDGQLVVEFGPSSRFHAEQVASEEWRDALQDILERVLGAALHVRCAVARDDAAAGGAAPEVAAAGAADVLDSDTAEAADVLDSEAAEAAGELPDDEQAHEQALETLTRDLGARLVDD